MMLSVPAINSSVAANTTRPVPRIPYLHELIQPLACGRTRSKRDRARESSPG
jgi:hypothetical protein